MIICGERINCFSREVHVYRVSRVPPPGGKAPEELRRDAPLLGHTPSAQHLRIPQPRRPEPPTGACKGFFHRSIFFSIDSAVSMCWCVYSCMQDPSKFRIEMEEEKVAEPPQMLGMGLHIAMATFSLAEEKDKARRFTCVCVPVCLCVCVCV